MTMMTNQVQIRLSHYSQLIPKNRPLHNYPIIVITLMIFMEVDQHDDNLSEDASPGAVRLDVVPDNRKEKPQNLPGGHASRANLLSMKSRISSVVRTSNLTTSDRSFLHVSRDILACT